jgi:Kef-type K+ transport system membrane component KefB
METEVTAFLQIVILLAIMLFCAKTAGYISTRFGQPSVLGELIVGVILGPSLINLVHLPAFSAFESGEFIREFAEIGVLFLMFLAGLELHISELAQNKAASALGGIFGVLVPIGLGCVVGEIYGYDFNHAMFLGLTLGATSVSISAQTLMELKMLRTRVGLGLLGAAVFDDMLVILILSTFLAIESGGASSEIILVIFKMMIFLAGSAGFGYWLIPWIAKKVNRLAISQGTLTFAVIILFVYAASAELVGGMAAISGAFIAGLMFSRTPQKAEVERGIKSIAYGLFVPIFFVNIGLSVNIRELDGNTFWVMLFISLAAIIGKIIGSGFGAKLGKFSWIESLQLGVGMVSRGEVGLIVASVGLRQNLLSAELFSAIIGMVLITTLVTPPLLHASFAKRTNLTTPVELTD